MTIKVNIRELDRGTLPSRWSWFIEVNRGGVPSMAGSGTEDDLATASKEAIKAAQEYLDATTDFRVGEKVVVVDRDRDRERAAKVVGFGTAGVFVEFDDTPSMGAWAYNRSSIRRKL